MLEQRLNDAKWLIEQLIKSRDEARECQSHWGGRALEEREKRETAEWEISRLHKIIAEKNKIIAEKEKIIAEKEKNDKETQI